MILNSKPFHTAPAQWNPLIVAVKMSLPHLLDLFGIPEIPNRTFLHVPDLEDAVYVVTAGCEIAVPENKGGLPELPAG